MTRADEAEIPAAESRSGIERPESDPPGRLVARDWLLLLSLVAFAGILRFWKITDLGLTHFDEGSYAMAGKWIASLGREGWPIQAGHAPALFPLLVGVFFKVFGAIDTAAIAVSGASGAATAGLLYLIGSRWFGRAAGTIAALFLAVCEYHLIYSRLALTDATFTLLYWASLAAFFQGVQGGKARWTLVGGLLAGLCWNTKYHGFFPLLISGVWLGLGIVSTARLSCWLSALKKSHWASAAGLATAMFLPWVLLVHFTIGYGPILRGQLDHSSFAKGLIVTPPGAVYVYLISWVAPPLLACAALGLLAAVARHRREALFPALAVGLHCLAALFYTSFPRLILPVVPGICLLAAFALDEAARSVGPRWGRWLPACGATLIVGWSLIPAVPVLQTKTDAYRRAAAYIETLEGPVVTQLSKNYYFYERRKSLEIRWQKLEDLNRLLEESPSAFLAVDPIIHRQPEILRWVESLRPRLKPLRRFEVNPYEPLHYQGFDPTLELESLPLSTAPTRPGQVIIEIHRIEKP